MKKIILTLFISGFIMIHAKNIDSTLSATMVGYNSTVNQYTTSYTSVLITQGETSILVNNKNQSDSNPAKQGVDIENLSAKFMTNHNFSFKEHEEHKEKFLGDETTFFVNNIKITTLKLANSQFTIAYRFEHKNISIIVAGDLTYKKELFAFAKNVDFLIINSGGRILFDQDINILQ